MLAVLTRALPGRIARVKNEMVPPGYRSAEKDRDVNQEDYRNHFRIEVPETHLVECAVWFKRKGPLSRMSLLELGKPHMAKGDRMGLRIEDISAAGMAVSFAAHPKLPAERLAERTVLVYFKLADPIYVVADPTCLLVAAEIKAVNQWDGKVYLSLRLTHNAAPDLSSKAVNFVGSEKYGIAELTRWCDEMDRRSCNQDTAMTQPGVQMDKLLLEISALTDPCPAKGGK